MALTCNDSVKMILSDLYDTGSGSGEELFTNCVKGCDHGGSGSGS